MEVIMTLTFGGLWMKKSSKQTQNLKDKIWENLKYRILTPKGNHEYSK